MPTPLYYFQDISSLVPDLSAITALLTSIDTHLQNIEMYTYSTQAQISGLATTSNDGPQALKVCTPNGATMS